MPGHKTHDHIGIVSIAPIAGVALYLGTTIQDITTLAIGIAVGTYYLSPDLDLHSEIYNRWGLLRWIWIPYQKAIPHRSWISHSGPISATLRMLYLYLWLLPFILYFHITIPHIQYTVVWVAFVIADILHVLADLLVKDKK